jgi:hypothetical protein
MRGKIRELKHNICMLKFMKKHEVFCGDMGGILASPDDTKMNKKLFFNTTC